jgi:hypothetical protein
MVVRRLRGRDGDGLRDGGGRHGLRGCRSAVADGRDHEDGGRQGAQPSDQPPGPATRLRPQQARLERRIVLVEQPVQAQQLVVAVAGAHLVAAALELVEALRQRAVCSP